ncbi:MAG: Xaa-Pro peptidase family protein [Candidatus Omnitrophica bacterium]|nr:Xaa-Pro peptidase family protein [Candidatus Omnitrophota bacterium]
MKRIKKIDTILAQKKLDAFLITKQVNVEYISGFSGDDALLLIVPGKLNLIITDGRFIQEASKLTDFTPEITNQKITGFLASKLRKLHLKRVGFESNGLTYGQYNLLKEACYKNTELIPLDNIIEEMRMIKDKEEIRIIKQAINISIIAFENLFSELTPGYSENTIANRLEYLIRAQGAECSSFKIIVATGSNTSYPHAVPSSKKWRIEEPLLIDWGARLKGYNCDLTRTIFSYKINPIHKRIYKILSEVQEKAISFIKPGIEARRIDILIRKYLKKYKIDKLFLHSSGHGVGKEVHEPPWISQQNETVLRENMLFTIEPGIYLKGKYGMRIEDMVWVRSHGCEIISSKLKKIYIKE